MHRITEVSIHGPPEGRPKPGLSGVLKAFGMFQSTAHPKAGRNAVTAQVAGKVYLFQSTAHPKAGRNTTLAPGGS